MRPWTRRSNRIRSSSVVKTKRMPIPGSLSGPGASAPAIHCTSPVIWTGSESAGTESANRNLVPMGKGRAVLMNVPPFEMFLV